MARKYSFFEKFIFPVSLVVAAVTLLSSLAPFVSPARYWPVALLGIGFPYVYLLNALFLLFWIYRKKWLLVIPLVPLLTGFGTASGFLGFSRGQVPDDAGPASVKVMSFNVRNFDLYNWTANWLGTARVREDIMDLIRSEDPDVICFQEFYTSDTGQFRTVEYLTNEAGYRYRHLQLPIYLHNQHHWGMAIFSRLPLARDSIIPFGTDEPVNGRQSINMCMYSDIVTGKDTLRVYNLHFQSIRFGRADYQLINQVGTGLEENKLKGFGNILGRLRTAFGKREKQVDLVLAHVRESPYPVVVCGDFNDTPSSRTYRAFTSLLQDAFLQSGLGIGSTYTGPFPAFRIDYILVSPELQSSRFVIPDGKKLSDHYPVMCRVHLPR